MAGRLDLTIEKGSTFERVFTWKTRDNETGSLDLVSLSGYNARAMFREEYDSQQPFISLTTGNGISIDYNTSEITIEITAAQSSAITADRGVWDLEVYTSEDETVFRLLEGKVKLKPEVTR